MRRLRLSFLVIGALLTVEAHAQPSTVIVVRHAEKASQTDKDPELSAAGTERARALATALTDAHVTSIITTQLIRTKQTALPTATAGHITPVVVENSGDVAAHVAAVVAAIRARPAGSIVLVVGHSNTVSAIIAELGGPRMSNICDSQYSNLYVLEMVGATPPKMIHANYGAADPADPACAKP